MSMGKTTVQQSAWRIGIVAGLSFAALAMAGVGAAQAQSNYPNKPIKLIVPWPPGGGVDTSARVISAPLSERLGQPIVIENKPGAGGNIGTAISAQEKPDGYSLLMASISPNSVNPHMYSNPGFDPVKDFAPIAYGYTVPSFLVVPASSPFNSAQELVAFAKANPGKLNFGSSGIGSSQHLATIMLQMSTNIDVVHVPFKGTAPAETALLAGQLDFMLDPPTCFPYIEAKKLKALAVGSRERNPAMPNVPTFDEVGIPGVYTAVYYGFMAPAKTPKEIITRLNKEINAILQTEDVRNRVTKMGGVITIAPPEDFGKFANSELERYGEIVKRSGARVD